jgi:hypothetical protein
MAWIVLSKNKVCFDWRILSLFLIICWLDFQKIGLVCKKIVEVIDEISLSITAIGICWLFRIIIKTNAQSFNLGIYLYDFILEEKNIPMTFMILISTVIIFGITTKKIKIFNVKTLFSGQRSVLIIGIISGFIFMLIQCEDLCLHVYSCDSLFIINEEGYIINYNTIIKNIYNCICDVNIFDVNCKQYIHYNHFYYCGMIFCIYVLYFIVRMFVWMISDIIIWMINIINASISFFVNILKKKELGEQLIFGTKKIISYIKEYMIFINDCILNKYEEIIMENPIETEELDSLGFYDYASLFAEKMLNSDMHTFAILGEYGYGKSSFANLMWNRFHKLEISSVRVKIDTWGLPNNAIMGYIIRQIQKELYKYADTLRISDIDEKYQNLISPKSQFLWGILDFLKTKRSQAELVDELDDFLFSIGKKIFVVIEDFDRLENEELFANIAAFLDFCKYTKNIYVIISIGNRNSNLTQTIIRCCVGCHSLASIAGTTETKDEIMKILEDYYVKNRDLNVKEQFNFDNDIELFANCFANVIETPRVLNTLKNRISMNWDKFQGNINLVDFCAYHILQLTKNDVRDEECSGYTYIIRNFEEICGAEKEYNLFPTNIGTGLTTLVDAITKKKKEISEKQYQGPQNTIDIYNLDKMLKEIHKIPEKQQIIIALLMYIVNMDKDKKGKILFDGQHLLCKEYSNYWLYLETGQFNIQGKITDQKDTDIIRNIELLNGDKKSVRDFYSYLQNKKGVIHKIKQFKKYLKINSLSELIIEYLIHNNDYRLVLEKSDFVDDLINWLRDDFTYDNELDNKIKEIDKLLVDNNIDGLLKFKTVYTNTPGDSSAAKTFNKNLADALRQYLFFDKNSEEHTKKFIQSLEQINKFELFNLVFANQYYSDTWRFLGDFFKNNINESNLSLLTQFNFLVTEGGDTFHPEVYFRLFDNPEQLYRIYDKIELPNEMKKEKELQDKAKSYLRDWEKNGNGLDFISWYIKTNMDKDYARPAFKQWGKIQ